MVERSFAKDIVYSSYKIGGGRYGEVWKGTYRGDEVRFFFNRRYSLLSSRPAPAHRGGFCQFPFRWIYYYGSNESTGKNLEKRTSVQCTVMRFLDLKETSTDMAADWIFEKFKLI